MKIVEDTTHEREVSPSYSIEAAACVCGLRYKALRVVFDDVTAKLANKIIASCVVLNYIRNSRKLILGCSSV